MCDLQAPHDAHADGAVDCTGIAPPRAPTLGQIAEVLRFWRALGVTPESVEYVIARVWWDR